MKVQEMKEEERRTEMSYEGAVLIDFLNKMRLDEDGLVRVYSDYRRRIVKYTDKSFHDAAQVVRRALMLSLVNEEFTAFCCEKAFYHSLAMTAKCSEFKGCIFIPEGFFRDFMNADRNIPEETLLSVLCQSASLFRGRCRKKLLEFLTDEREKCGVREMYYLLSDYFIKYDKDIERYFRDEIIRTHGNGRGHMTPGLNDPVYVLLRLYAEGCIGSVSSFKDILADEPAFMMTEDPAGFDFTKFDPGWWRLLSPKACRYILSRPGRKTVFNRIMDMKDISCCQIKALMCTLKPELAYQRIRDKKDADQS